MSYVVTLHRSTRIEREEVEALAQDSSQLAFDGSEGEALLHWTNSATDSRETFVLTDGELHITSPSDDALSLAQTIAGHLGATVRGEEGEDLSEVPVGKGSNDSTGCGTFIWSILLIAVLLGIYWWLN